MGGPNPERSRFADYAEDATGFGATEWRTFRDLLKRPRAVLDAYLERGPTGGGLYARPMGFYFALCGVLMIYMFIAGGLEGVIQRQPAEVLNGWIAASGKSRAEFIGDADGWMSLVSVPVLSFFYAIFSAPLLKWWGGLDWRRTFRSTFTLLNAWTVPVIFLGPLPMMERFALFASIFMYGANIVAFLRLGRGLWWKGWPGGILKGFLLLVVMMIGAGIGMFFVMQIGMMGALHGN
ncbi:hypothetical protein GCM10022280_17090 [Sphingomonas swuensis]|uniref:Yip1 domain-containing protein n=1 Tax=Sphingomonas swuensis TaxID=977800 RepID=A0ABP7SY36_9SPHN